MGRLTALSTEGEAAGLEVSVSGDRLVMSGKDAEPAATRLTARRAEVVAAHGRAAEVQGSIAARTQRKGDR